MASRFPDLLPPVVAHMVNEMKKIDGIINIEDTRPVPEIEWEIILDRKKAMLYGVDVSMVGSFIKFVTNGVRVTTYRPNDTDQEVDIMLRFPSDKRHLSMLDVLKVQTEKGAIMTLGSISVPLKA